MNPRSACLAASRCPSCSRPSARAVAFCRKNLGLSPPASADDHDSETSQTEGRKRTALDPGCMGDSSRAQQLQAHCEQPSGARRRGKTRRSILRPSETADVSGRRRSSHPEIHRKLDGGAASFTVGLSSSSSQTAPRASTPARPGASPRRRRCGWFILGRHGRLRVFRVADSVEPLVRPRWASSGSVAARNHPRA
jgi:hypothetical protein